MDYAIFSKKPFNLTDGGIERIKNIYATMDLDDKIGQLFFVVGYRQDEEFLKDVAGRLRTGGLMCRCMSAEQVTGTVAILQKNAKVPMLIAANLEAGANGIVKEGTKVASQMAVAATGNAENAYELGRICAEEATAVGANYAFAPVCDIDFNFRNPITNTRTYGNDPAFVAECASEYARACRERGVCYSAKHFPGDGVDERDQHLVTSVNSLSAEQWDETYGAVYKRLIDEGAPTVMVGHIALPAYEKKLCPSIADEDILPASLSENLLNGLLRKKLGFNGLIITDATTMAGFNVAMNRDEAVPHAIAAGCDMFLFTKNMQEDFAFMKAGIEKGVITAERLEEAVMRVLALKESMGLFDKDNVPVYDTCTYAAETVLGASWNEELAYEMGKMVGNEGIIGNERGDKMPYSGWYAPAVNIHRSAFGGRNWEYYSEDGLLSGRLAAQVVKGCAEKGVYCTVKHFAVNEQETNRDTNGLITWFNEQALREIYIKPFEIAVKEGGTTAIMSSFNRLGTTWAGGSYALLTQVLREEWGFNGMVITDYALKNYMNADQMIRAGGDLSLAQGARTPDIDRKGVDATTLAAMQKATKNILYTVANSNAMNLNIIGMRMPKWVRIMLIADAVVVVALAGWGAWAIISAKKKAAKKEENVAE